MTSLSVKEISGEIPPRPHYDEVSDQQKEFWQKNGWWCSICKRIRYLRPQGRQDLCEKCAVSKESSRPISCSVEDWSKKLENWSSEETISLVPVEALAPYLEEWFSLVSLRIKSVGARGCLKTINCSRGQKTYLMYLASCVQVCREWRDYFNDPIFWKPAYTRIAVNAFYEKKKDLLLAEKKKVPPRSKDWSREDINANRCKMVVVNETDGIPFDIYWITNTNPESCVKMGTIKDQYHCGRTYPNAKWMCIPTREWLIENKYSTVGFKWVIDVFSLKTFIKEDGTDILAYVMKIRQPDFSKMHPIKDIDKDFENYRKKIIPLVFNEKEVEYEWKKAKTTRKRDREALNELRERAKEIRKGIELSEKKSDDQMYVLNMFN